MKIDQTRTAAYFALRPYLGALFYPPYGAEVKINVRFELGILKNIEINILLDPIKHFALYPNSSPHMGMSDSSLAFLKILKSIYDMFQSNTMHSTPISAPTWSRCGN